MRKILENERKCRLESSHHGNRSKLRIEIGQNRKNYKENFCRQLQFPRNSSFVCFPSCFPFAGSLIPANLKFSPFRETETAITIIFNRSIRSEGFEFARKEEGGSSFSISGVEICYYAQSQNGWRGDFAKGSSRAGLELFFFFGRSFHKT